MKKAAELFSDEDLDYIASLISEVETRTCGEIVPVVATSSGRYDRAEDVFGAMLGVLLVVVAWLGFQDVSEDGGWSGHEPALGLLPVVLLFLGGLVAGAWLAARFPPLRLPFLPDAEMRAEVERAAAAAFHSCRVRSAGGRGVLLYISLYERHIRVLPDDEVGARIGQADWERVRDLVATALRDGRPRDAIVQGVTAIGELLERHFPPEPGQRSEVANVLRVLE